MDKPIDFYVHMILLTFMVLIASSIIGSNIYVTAAKNFHAKCLNNIEASNYSQDVIDGLKEDAKTTFGGGTNDCLSVDVFEVNGEKMAEVVLTYKYDIPMFGLDKEYELLGYAR